MFKFLIRDIMFSPRKCCFCLLIFAVSFFAFSVQLHSGIENKHSKENMPYGGRFEQGEVSNIPGSLGLTTEKYKGDGDRITMGRSESQNVELIGRWGSGPCWNVKVQGDTAYIADGGQLEIFNCSDVSSPEYLGSVALQERGWDVAVSGDYAYVASGLGGVRVIDISDPLNPAETGFYIQEYPEYSRAISIDISGDFAYVIYAAIISSSILVIDISDPYNPRYVGNYPDAGNGREIEVSGDYAYIASYSNGKLMVINISDPESPYLAGSCDIGKEATGVSISGVYAYMAHPFSGVSVIDISDPSNPALAGFCAMPHQAYKIKAFGNFAYLAAKEEGIRIVDISDPSNPYEAGHLDTEHNMACGIDISNGYAYVSDCGLDSGLRIVDVSNTSNPSQSGFHDTAYDCTSIEISGFYAYLGDWGSGLRIIDISDRSNPHEEGYFSDCPYIVTGIAVMGEYAYLADLLKGDLRVIDIADRSDPLEVGRHDANGNNYGVAVSGDYAYVAAGGDGLRVLDISSPGSPSEIGLFDTQGTPYGITISGDVLYLANGGPGLKIMDISDRSNPEEVGCCNTYIARDVAVEGNYAYVADGESGLKIIDISDPSDPYEISSYSTSGSYEGVAVFDSCAYVADSHTGLFVIDISDPAHPGYAGYYNTGYGALDVNIADGCAYLACNQNGLHVVRYEGADFDLFAGIQAERSGESIKLSWDIYGDYNDNLKGFNILRSAGQEEPILILSNLLSPETRSFTDVSVERGIRYSYSIEAISMEEEVISTEKASAELPPFVLALEPNYPNPFNPETNIPFTLPERGNLLIEVFDARGGLVRTIFNGIADSGYGEVTWDGRNNHGRAMESGIYFYRLKYGGKVIGRKAVLLR